MSDGTKDGAADVTPVPEAKPDEAATLRAQLDEAQAAAKRWQAEYLNYQQRVARDREADRKFGLEGLLREILPALDSVQRTLRALASAQAAASLVKAVEMSEKELLRVLARYGVKPVEARDAFDPALHDAIETVESADRPDGAIVEVLQPGYMLHDRLLRPATVRVAKKSGP